MSADFLTLTEELVPKPSGAVKSGLNMLKTGEAAAAIEIFRAAAEEGDRNAIFCLGWAYSSGTGTGEGPNGEKSMGYYRKASEQGQLSAQLALGMVLITRAEPGKPESAEGLSWIKKAAQGGQRDAQRQLGLIYVDGLVVEKNLKIGEEWLVKAAEAGDANGMIQLGVRYESGKITGKADPEQAFKYYKMAADTGQVGALLHLAKGYERGGYLKPDAEKAAVCYQKAEEAGSTEASYHLGRYYLFKDKERAAFQFKKAAEGGYDIAQVSYAKALMAGAGVPEDQKAAVSWFEKAVEQGNPQAMFEIGLLHKGGMAGKEKDMRQALIWFIKAGESGFAEAQNTLGGYYKEGKLLPRDNVAAVAWFTRAAAQGYVASQVNLGLMFEGGFGVLQDIGRAGQLYQGAAASGNMVAMYLMANLLDQGKGLPRDQVGAYVLYAQSANSYEPAIKERDRIGEQLSEDEMKRAQEALAKIAVEKKPTE